MAKKLEPGSGEKAENRSQGIRLVVMEQSHGDSHLSGRQSCSHGAESGKQLGSHGAENQGDSHAVVEQKVREAAMLLWSREGDRM